MSAPISEHLTLIDGDPDDAALAALAETATFAKRLIKDRTPVDTGKLKRAWRVQVTADGLQIENGKDYAGFVEGGTSKMTPRAMYSGAIPEIQAYYNRQLRLRQLVADRQQQRQNHSLDPAIAAAAHALSAAVLRRSAQSTAASVPAVQTGLSVDIDQILADLGYAP